MSKQLDAIAAALQKADAAGNVDDAKQLADAYRAQLAAESQPLSSANADANRNAAYAAGSAPQAAANVKGAFSYPIGTQVSGAASAFGHHALNSLIGLGQAGEHAASYVSSKVLPSSWQAPIDAGVARDDRAIQSREQGYQASVPNSAGAYAGATGGEVLPWMVGVGELRALGLLPKVTGVLGKTAALTGGGALMGLTQPVTNVTPEQPYGEQKALQIGAGALTAPILSGALGGLGRLGKAAGRYATSSGRDALANQRLGQMLHSAGADPSQLAGYQSPVAGYVPSLAEANPGAKMVRVQQDLQNNPIAGPILRQTADNNNIALRNAAAGVAGTDADMQAAIAARKAATQPFRDANLPETGSPMIDPQSIVERLQTLAKSANATVRAAAKEHLGLIDDNSVGGKIPAYNLEDIRQNVGSMLAKYAPNGAVGTAEQAKYGPVQDAITNTLDTAIPGYRDYLAAYAKHSQPINDMEAGTKLLDAIDSSGRDASGNQNIAIAAVRRALNLDDKARHGMSDAARNKVDSIMEALQQRTIPQNPTGSAGSQSAANLLSSLSGSRTGKAAAGIGTMGVAHGLANIFGIPGFLAQPAADAAGYGVYSALRSADADIMQRIAQRAANPQEAAKAIAAYRAAKLAAPKGRLNPLQLLTPYQPQLPPPP